MNKNARTTWGGIIIALSIALGILGPWLQTGHAPEVTAITGAVGAILGALKLGIAAASTDGK